MKIDEVEYANISFTVNYLTSNAQNYQEFGGFFVEGGGVVGLGLGGGVAKFYGASGVSGTTYSFVLATGASAAAGISYTDVGLSINLRWGQ